MSVGLLGSSVFVAGTAAGVLSDVGVPIIVASTIIVVVLAMLWPHRIRLVLALACAGTAMGATARADVLRPLPVDWIAGGPVTRAGMLQSDAVVTPSGVRVDLIIDGWRVRATVTGTLAGATYTDWIAGRTFVAPIRLRRPDIVRNPGSPSERWQTLTRRFDFIGTIKSGALVDVQPGPWRSEAAARVRAHVRRTTTTWLAPYAPSTQAVVTAILIGDRAGLDEAVVRRLQAAGTFHVIAISGGNVAMLTMACFLGLRLLSRSHRVPVVITIGVVAAYGAVVGSEASVTRAVAAAITYLCLRLVSLPPRPVNLLMMVAVICVLRDPMTVIDVGAWLSFGATFGLIVVLPQLLMTAGVTTMGRVRRLILAACLATAAAEIVIVPITAGVFARVGIAGLLLNLVAIPAMVVAQFAGMALCVLVLVSSTAAGAAAALAHLATRVLLGSSAALDFAPWLSWRVPSTSLWWTVAYYGAVALALWWIRPRWRRAAVVAAAVIAGVIVSSPFVSQRRPAPGWLRISVLDVGQGDAILVQTPNRRALLMDAGGSPAGTFDVGGRVVTPAVWALGERRLDWLALSHGDLDHIGGARRVLDDLSPGEVWEGIAVESSEEIQHLRAAAQAQRITWRRVLAGHELDVGAVQMTVRHPARPDWQRVRVRNDDSLVLEVRYGDVAFLLTGDAGPEFETAPLDTRRVGAPPRIRLLKVAHHGSRSSTTNRFLDAFDPRIALISAGAHNLFGHPAEEVLSRLAGRDVHTFRTDRHGAVIVETDGRQVRVRPIVGGRLDVF
jgi:competence protein ComEC